MFESPQSRQVLREQIMLFARDNGVIFLGECSAKCDINIKQTFEKVTEQIRDVQIKLVKQGDKDIKSLKLKDEDTSLNFAERCCY